MNSQTIRIYRKSLQQLSSLYTDASKNAFIVPEFELKVVKRIGDGSSVSIGEMFAILYSMNYNGLKRQDH